MSRPTPKGARNSNVLGAITARVPRRTAEAAAKTRIDLTDAGRALFADPGFAATTLEDVAARAGVTRGALCHHFASKEALFEAVFRLLQDEMTFRSKASVGRRRSPLSRFRAGCDAFLDSCLAPDIARIVLLDGPSVLGWETWRAYRRRTRPLHHRGRPGRRHPLRRDPRTAGRATRQPPPRRTHPRRHDDQPQPVARGRGCCSREGVSASGRRAGRAVRDTWAAVP